MSLKIAKELNSQVRSIEELKGKIVAIDISPWLYKYMFTYNKDAISLSNSKGTLTGHLVGFLYFLKNLKKVGISPVICLDGTSPDIKKEEVLKRVEQRSRTFNKYDVLEKHGLNLNHKQKQSKLNSTLYIGVNEKGTIIKCCELLGIPYYSAPFVQGEKACALLKADGIVDQCLTVDRDAILYGVSFYSKIDFKANTITYYDYDSNLHRLGLKDHAELMKVIICTGCDYTPGLYGIGPKKIFNLLSNPEILNQLIEKEIPNYNQIYSELMSNLPLTGLKRGMANPHEFVLFLRELEFKEPNILHFCNHLF